MQDCCEDEIRVGIKMIWHKMSGQESGSLPLYPLYKSWWGGGRRSRDEHNLAKEQR